ncbi:hypothetical protein CO726_09790 [Bacillus fungorum]|uniref:Uncharacterized protein n=1 Tax=Bacillus fungorum TaxID=2039284 RepID=A0A2G6QFI1_9BACI|nr:hypothetical protein [Bacillus fungorum]PIE95584.1 hypothetical protein CO726_09790 [Bacillus fungorum]
MFVTEEALIKRLKHEYKKKLFFEEIGGGYGIADLIVIKNKTEFLRFLESRNGVHFQSNEQIKIFMYLWKKRKGVSFEEILSNHYIPAEKLKYKILKYLVSIEAVTLREGKYFRNKSFNIFSADMVAIEGKLSNWQSGLAQAIRYQRFARSTYVALDVDYIHRVDLNEFKKYNVGLISVGSKVQVLNKPHIKQPLDPVMRYRIAENIIQASSSLNTGRLRKIHI